MTTVLFPGEQVRTEMPYFRLRARCLASRRWSHGRPLLVQPVSLAYTRLDGMPVGRALRPISPVRRYDSCATFLEVAGLGHTTVDVVFHSPVTIAGYESRKALADHCQAVISRGVSAANAGRLDALLPVSTS